METNGFAGVGNHPVDAVISEGQDNVHEIQPPSEEAFSKEMREDKHRSVEPADHDAVMNEAIDEPSATTTPFTPPLNNVQSPEENASPVFEHPLSPTTAEGMSALRIEDIVTPISPAFPTSAEASVDLVETTAPASQDIKDMDVEEVTEKRPRNPQQHNPPASNQTKKQTPLPATTQSSTSVQVTNGRKGPGISRDQQKYCSSIIKVLKKHRDAFPFLKPVDIVAFNIPHYPEIIKHPMDLSLVEQKLDNLQYASPEEFASDVQLIFNNCYIFNGRDSEVSKMAEGMEATFERQMQKMPMHKEPPVVKEVAPKVNTEPPPKPPVALKAENPAPVAAPPKKGGGKISKKTPTPPPPPRRFSEDGRPKREIHPPPPKDLPEVPSTKRNPRTTDPQLKWGSLVIKEVKKNLHREYNWPFLHPVDPIALNIPDYPTIVKTPMDISTIERKLRDGEYANGIEFEEDWRLMFANCYLYNPEGTLVNMLGHKMEALFDSKWAEKPPPPEVEEDQESSEEDSADLEKEKTIANLQRTLEIVQAQLQTITQQPTTKKKKDKKDKTKSHGTQKPAKAGAGKTTVKPKPIGKRKRPGKGKGEEEYPEFTFEQKKELSEKINSMDQDQLPEVVRIIQSSMPLEGGGEEEIELDIDALDRRILHKLHTFVVGKPAARKRPPAKKAKTHFSEEESNRKIFKLEQKLEEFNQKIGPTSSQDVNMNEDDGSSSDSDSGSSSSGSESDDSDSEFADEPATKPMASFPQYQSSTSPPETHSVITHIKITTPKSRSKSPTRGSPLTSRPIITPRLPSKLSIGETSGSATRPGLALGRPKTASVTGGVGPTVPGVVKPIAGVGIGKGGGSVSVVANGGPIDEKKVNLKLENVDKWNALAAQKPVTSTVTDDKSTGIEASAASKRSDAAWEEFKRQRREEHDRAKLLAAQVDEKKRQAEMEERKKKQEEEEQKKKRELEEQAKKDEEKARIERMREEERKAREERYQKDTVDLFAQSIMMARFEKEMYQSQDFVRRQKDELRRQERMIKTFAGKNQKPLTVLGQLSDVARAALLGRSNGSAAGRDVKEGSENGATPRAVSEDAKTPMDMEVVDAEDMIYEPGNI